MISIIMSTYKEEESLLRQSIESILKQTYRDFEFIIILDNPENEMHKRVIEEYVLRDSRIHFYINEKNMGLTHSLNRGIDLAKGEYIARMDADDISLVDRLERQLEYLEKNHYDLIGGITEMINEDGSLSYKSVKEEYVDKNGKLQFRMQKSTKMAETKDARTLSSGTPQEEAYADYANSMKSLANQARREMMSTGKIAYSASAKATYSEEVKSLNAKLDLALANAPRERQAQTMANATVAAKRKDNPDMTKAEVKKASQQALAQARSSVGAKRSNIEITDKEWEAIQAGAISENKLTQILNNTNTDTIRQRATPRASTALSTAKQNRIAALSASGYSTSEIAEALGVSSSTVSKYLNGKE